MIHCNKTHQIVSSPAVYGARLFGRGLRSVRTL